MSAANAEPAMVIANAARFARKNFLIEHSPDVTRGGLEGNPGMEEQGVVVLGTDRGAVELVVIDVLQADAGVEPRPAERLAGAERDIGDLGDPAVAVRRQRNAGDWISAEQRGIRSTPDIEILPGQDHAVILSQGHRGL